jgi:hypothetical protein
VATPDAVGLDPATLCGIGPHFQAQAGANIAGMYHSPIQGSVPLSVLNRYVLPAVKQP